MKTYIKRNTCNSPINITKFFIENIKNVEISETQGH